MARKHTSEEKEANRQEAFQMHLRGISVPVIARKLEVHERTVSRYLKESRAKVAKGRMNYAEEDDVNMYIESMNDAIRRANWHLTEIPRGSSAAVPWMRLIVDCEEKKARAVGVLDKIRLTGPDGRSNPKMELDWTNIVRQIEQAKTTVTEEPRLTLADSETVDANFFVYKEDK